MTQSHTAGEVNGITREQFHEVTAIHEPGRTLSLMICGLGERGAWGHLDPGSGVFELNDPSADPGFSDRLYAINPQHSRTS